SIEKISKDDVVIHDGTFTSCTQPVPNWSFRIHRGLFHLGHYAHLHGVSLRVRDVPVVYLPWLVWPIKRSPATRLLCPPWGSSRPLGWFAGEALFWELGDHADMTFYGDYYSRAGPAGGAEFRWLPSARGKIYAEVYGLTDRRTGDRRYTATFKGEQPL